jgi:hypothetical protein
MFRFPKILPEITITDLPGEDFEVDCLDDQGGFVLLAPGEEVEFAFYDYPGDNHASRLAFSGAHRLRVGGRILIEGVQALEVDWWYAQVGYDYGDRTATTYNVLDEEGHHIVGWIQRFDPEQWVFERYDMTALPVLLRPGLRVPGTERVRVGEDIVRESEIAFEVAGAVQIIIGSKPYKALRVYCAYTNGAGAESLAEYYVADTGRTIYFRRYDGPASSRYDADLKSHHVLNHRGIPWRHFYDSIPDHALVIGL